MVENSIYSTNYSRRGSGGDRATKKKRDTEEKDRLLHLLTVSRLRTKLYSSILFRAKNKKGSRYRAKKKTRDVPNFTGECFRAKKQKGFGGGTIQSDKKNDRHRKKKDRLLYLFIYLL